MTRRLSRPFRFALALLLASAAALAMPRPSSGAPEAPSEWLVPGVRLEPLAPAGEIDVDGLGAYRGSIELQATGAGLTVVNRVALDDYVRGIAEMPADWPAAALEAQAIAARTYALWELQAGKQLCATDACQVYAGLTKERSDPGGWAAAVAATRGQVLLWKGGPILAMYSSSNGGLMVAGSQPYLRSGNDPDDAVAPMHTWHSTVGLDALQPLFATPGPVTGVARTNHDTVALTWVASSPSTTEAQPGPAGDRAAPATATGESPTTTPPPTEATTTTTTTWPSPTDPTTTPPPTTSTSQPPAQPTTTTTTAAPPPSSGQVEVATDAFVQKLNSTQPAPDGLPRVLPSPRFEIRVDQPTNAAVFDGRGFGHGIGMSQFGALGKARRGMKAPDILAAYYGGIRPSAAPAGSLPDLIPVTLDDARGVTGVSSPNRFRVVAADGSVLAFAGSGRWQFAAAGGQVRVTPPPDQQGPLRLVPIDAHLAGARAQGTQGTVEVKVSLSLPAEVKATVVAVPPPTTTQAPDADPLAAPPTPPPPPPSPVPAAGSATAPAAGPGDTVVAIPIADPAPQQSWVVHLEANAGGGRVAVADVPLELVRASTARPAAAGHDRSESALDRLPGPAAVRNHPIALLLLALASLVGATVAVGVTVVLPRLQAR